MDVVWPDDVEVEVEPVEPVEPLESLELVSDTEGESVSGVEVVVPIPVVVAPPVEVVIPPPVMVPPPHCPTEPEPDPEPEPEPEPLWRLARSFWMAAWSAATVLRSAAVTPESLIALLTSFNADVAVADDTFVLANTAVKSDCACERLVVAVLGLTIACASSPIAVSRLFTSIREPDCSIAWSSDASAVRSATVNPEVCARLDSSVCNA